MTDQIDRLVRALLDACDAKDALLVCYRIGKRPSETLFRKLDRAKAAIEKARAFLEKP